MGLGGAGGSFRKGGVSNIRERARVPALCHEATAWKARCIARSSLMGICAVDAYHCPTLRRRRLMILGMSIATFTVDHVIISLIGIAAGLVVLYGLLGSNRLPGWTALFLAATVLTSVTGFFFPFAG